MRHTKKILLAGAVILALGISSITVFAVPTESCVQKHSKTGCFSSTVTRVAMCSRTCVENSIYHDENCGYWSSGTCSGSCQITAGQSSVPQTSISTRSTGYSNETRGHHSEGGGHHGSHH